jgi:hypothetical protein
MEEMFSSHLKVDMKWASEDIQVEIIQFAVCH